MGEVCVQLMEHYSAAYLSDEWMLQLRHSVFYPFRETRSKFPLHGGKTEVISSYIPHSKMHRILDKIVAELGDKRQMPVVCFSSLCPRPVTARAVIRGTSSSGYEARS